MSEEPPISSGRLDLDDPRSEGHAERSRRRRFGQRLGRYQLGTLVGSGGAGSVYMARLDGPHGFERLLALKLVHEHLLGEREFLAMFLDEANLSARLSHPNIVHTYELGRDGDALFIAMEYLQGQPLSRLYRRARSARDPLPYGVLAWVGARAAEALHYAHELAEPDGSPLGIIHRDVSPDNLFVTYEGQIKLLDFGIARATRRLSQTNLGQVKGKFRYMAPEYCLGEPYDRRLDVFALGASLYEVAVGEPAFPGADEAQVLAEMLVGEVRPPHELRPDFPEPLWGVIRRSLAPRPEDRFPDARAMALALDDAARLSPSEAQLAISSCVRRLFADELGAEANDIAELRGLARPEEPPPTPHGHAVTASRPVSVERSHAPVLAAVGVVAAIGIGLWTMARTRPEPARPLPDASNEAAQATATPEEPSSVTLSVTSDGEEPITVRVGEASATGHPAEVSIRRAAEPVWLEVTAPGRVTRRLSITPNRDRSLHVTLDRAAPVASVAARSASSIRPSAPAIATASVPRRPATPAESAAPRSAPGPGGVIKSYPF